MLLLSAFSVSSAPASALGETRPKFAEQPNTIKGEHEKIGAFTKPKTHSSSHNCSSAERVVRDLAQIRREFGKKQRFIKDARMIHTQQRMDFHQKLSCVDWQGLPPEKIRVSGGYMFVVFSAWCEGVVLPWHVLSRSRSGTTGTLD